MYLYKKEHKLFVFKGKQEFKSYDIALCSFNPDGDKEKLGDGGTPEGRFFICEMIPNPGKSRYGARSMRLSYPGIEDARRGLKDKIINYETYLEILDKIRMGGMPKQTTALGGSIRQGA